MESKGELSFEYVRVVADEKEKKRLEKEKEYEEYAKKMKEEEDHE